MNENKMLDKALKFATEKHDGQTRQDHARTPYITHPIEVASLVKLSGGSVKAQIMAVLHDVIEDTNTTYEELIDEFNQEIADGVMELSDNTEAVYNRLMAEHGEEKAKEIVNNDRLLRREFKVQQAVDMSHKSLEAREVKIADKVSNVRSLVEAPTAWTPKNQLGYLEACKAVVEAGRGTNKYLEDMFDKYYNMAKLHIEENMNGRKEKG